MKTTRINVSPDLDPNFTPRRKVVMAGIRAGYGVEDISVNEGIGVSAIRRDVAWLRRLGYLGLMFNHRGDASNNKTPA